MCFDCISVGVALRAWLLASVRPFFIILHYRTTKRITSFPVMGCPPFPPTSAMHWLQHHAPRPSHHHFLEPQHPQASHGGSGSGVEAGPHGLATALPVAVFVVAGCRECISTSAGPFAGFAGWVVGAFAISNCSVSASDRVF